MRNVVAGHFLCFDEKSSSQQETQNIHLSKDDPHVSRRYAELSLASELSKIMDSKLQKNFVDFLLNQREEKSKAAATEEADPEKQLCNDLHLL
ncbi:hypothetical protein NQZ68_025250 [Dissostichus eleginoides]|nr:hypothetical protein NQZ68_025250 [Dissostichus eleginoides]